MTCIHTGIIPLLCDIQCFNVESVRRREYTYKNQHGYLYLVSMMESKQKGEGIKPNSAQVLLLFHCLCYVNFYCVRTVQNVQRSRMYSTWCTKYVNVGLIPYNGALLAPHSVARTFKSVRLLTAEVMRYFELKFRWKYSSHFSMLLHVCTEQSTWNSVAIHVHIRHNLNTSYEWVNIFCQFFFAWKFVPFFLFL